MSLVLTSAPVKGESLEGFVARLAALNAHPGPHWILQASKLRDGFDRRASDLGLLAELTDVPVRRLEAMTHWPLADRPSRLRFAAHSVQMSALALYQDRVCPLCVAEEGIARQLWHLKTYAVCHVHQVALVDQCNVCGWRLRWQRPALDRCRCGSQLRASGDRAPTAALEVSRRLDQIARTSPGSGFADLGLLAKVIWFFGTDHGKPDWRARFMAKPTVDDAVATAAHAAPFVFDWDAAMADWLQRFLPAPDKEVSCWILEVPILLRLKSAFHQPESEYILDLVKAHLSAVWDQGLRRRSEFCAAPRQGEYVRRTEAARLLRLNGAQVKRLIVEGAIEGTTQKRGTREFSTISRASIDAYLAADPWLPPAEAAEYLGVPRDRLAKMRTRWKLEFQVRGRGNFYLAPSLDEFIERLAPRLRGPGSGYRPWSEVRFRNRVLDLVLLGKLEAFRHPPLGSGVRALLFEESALRQATVHMRQVAPKMRGPDEDLDLLTAGATVRRLAVNHNTLRELVARGFLVGQFRGTSLCSVELQSLSRFEQQFSSVQSFAQRRDLLMRVVLYRLRWSGEAPVLAPNADKRLRAIWRLETLEGLDFVKRLPRPPQFEKNRAPLRRRPRTEATRRKDPDSMGPLARR